jgi:hypothetical protein
LYGTGTILSSVREITQINKISKPYNFRIKSETGKCTIGPVRSTVSSHSFILCGGDVGENEINK